MSSHWADAKSALRLVVGRQRDLRAAWLIGVQRTIPPGLPLATRSGSDATRRSSVKIPCSSPRIPY